MNSTAARPTWRTGRGVLSFDKPCVMGILNVTPDSFWDGGRHSVVTAALHHAEQLLSDGADIVDVGGESSRPGAQQISEAEELARIQPVISQISKRWPDAIISVDTVKAGVARVAAANGAAIINDVSGLRFEPALGRIAAESGLGLVLMHSRGAFTEMARYESAIYGDDAVGEITADLQAAWRRAREQGVADAQIVLDPGLGFSKRTRESVAAVGQLDRLLALGRPLLVGPSRKRFIGELSGNLPVEERLEGTIAACVVALMKGASIFRVHDVQAVRRALDVASAIVNEKIVSDA